MDSPISVFGPAPPLFAGERRFQRPKKAMELAGFSKSTLYRLLKEGRIRARKLNRMTLIDMTSIAELFERCPEVMPAKHVEARTITAAQLGLDEGPNLPEPRDPDGPLDFRLDGADLDALSGPSREPNDTPVSPEPLADIGE
jgi:predicted DNA-binding transcriptional regulator AlpA